MVPNECKALFCFRVALLFVSFPRIVRTASFPDGVYKTECRSRSFWIWVERDFLGPQWQLETFNETGYPVVMDDYLSSQCGYTKSRDIYGNVEIRISFLGCWIHNVNDEQFNSLVRFKVAKNGVDSQYMVSQSCRLTDPWNMREIVCEENYMEVSVIRIIPLENWLKTDIRLSWPATQGGASPRWQVEFIVNNSIITLSSTNAFKKGYGLNATATRVVFRAPYRTAESVTMMVDGYRYAGILGMMYYSQPLVRLYVNTTLACPSDPPIFTPTSLMWRSPAILSPLVLDPTAYIESDLNLGLDGQLIDSSVITKNGYVFQTRPTAVEVIVPIGAPGGNIESVIVNNSYGTIYRIHLLLVHEWRELPADVTRHTILKPIATAFRPEVPVFINRKCQITDDFFEVSLGNFFSDVELKSLEIKKVPFTLEEAKARGFNVMTVPNANGTNAFYLQVPFSDSLVEQKHLQGHLLLYTLHVTYIMTLLTKQDFQYTDVVECIRQDVEPPSCKDECGPDRLILVLTHGNMDRYWVPYIRELHLTKELAQSQKYVVSDQGSIYRLEVPLFAAGLSYKEISLRGVLVALNFTLRDNKTLDIKFNCLVECRFPTDRLLVCLPNGTMAATVLGLDTKPNFNPARTHLKDPTCKPQEVDDTRALFVFPVFSCGTIRRFDGDFFIYENEVTFDREYLPQDQPIITRDSKYRLTLRCKYPVRDTQRMYGRYNKTTPIRRGFSAVLTGDKSKVLRKRAKDRLDAVLRVAKDDAFTSFYQSGDFPVYMARDTSLNLEADINGRMAGMSRVVLRECWTTPTPQMDGSPQWDLVANGCAKDGAAYSTKLQTSPDSPPRFQVKIGSGLHEPGNQIYIHCLISLHDDDAISCNGVGDGPEQRMGKRSVLQRVPYEAVSAGPIQILARDNGVAYQCLGDESWSVWTWILSAGLAVFAVVTIAAVTLAVRLFVC
ncbi:uncharacterized protein LOC128491594 [Spea bombifrons]|uniref:uncharacterized protein LOC128491594 n=1 Tax=Spea bombifrons TaxID=233779 RepID=UPI00234A0158|nr:uncharacterized protein LOC128491594 [Spea bombifrons]